jgi:hypothetical protein
MANWPRGKDAKVYYGAAAADLAAMTELTAVRDVTPSLEKEEIECSVKGETWASKRGGLKSASVDVEIRADVDNAGVVALRDAFLNDTLIELAFLSGVRDGDGVEGLKGTFDVTKFSPKHPLSGGQTIDVTAVLQTFGEWVEPEES